MDGLSSEHIDAVKHYYKTNESRIGYATILGGTKHFGYYRPGDATWRLRSALRRMEDVLGTQLGLQPGSRVLDAGCGMGDVATRLASPRWGLNLTGIDILDFNLAVARRRARRRGVGASTQFALMDYADLDFPDRSFDGAYTMETLVHSDRVEQVLAGVYRVLRPGGRLVHFEYSRQPPDRISPSSAQMLKDVNAAAAMPAFDRLNHGVLETLLTDAGFVDIQTTDITAHMLPMLRAFSVLSQGPYALARLLRRPERAVNAMSGVEFYRRQECWRYNIYACRKPLT